MDYERFELALRENGVSGQEAEQLRHQLKQALCQTKAFDEKAKIQAHELKSLAQQYDIEENCKSMSNGSKKDTNPKDAVGVKKAPVSTISAPVIVELGVAMMEGALKYGRHNYRVSGVRASVYYDACFRHMADWWEGEDIDPDSGLSHVTKAIASLTVLRDAMINGAWVDDRPPSPPKEWLRGLNQTAANLIDKYPEPVAAYTELNKDDKR